MTTTVPYLIQLRVWTRIRLFSHQETRPKRDRKQQPCCKSIGCVYWSISMLAFHLISCRHQFLGSDDGIHLTRPTHFQLVGIGQSFFHRKTYHSCATQSCISIPQPTLFFVLKCPAQLSLYLQLTGFRLWRCIRRHPFGVLILKGCISLKIAGIRPILRVSASHFRGTCVPLY